MNNDTLKQTTDDCLTALGHRLSIMRRAHREKCQARIRSGRLGAISGWDSTIKGQREADMISRLEDLIKDLKWARQHVLK